jgi:hypothetical protein
MVSKTKEKQMKEVYERLLAYRHDPCGFMTNCLDVKPEHLWSKMVEVAESVRDNQFTAVPAAFSVSKTYGAGRIAVWFKSCFQPSTVITTAPSDNQVRNQLWREIHAAHAGAKIPLGGNLTSLMWDVKPSKAVLERLAPSQKGMWEMNFAIGFSTSPDQATEHATKMHGWHNRWVLIILDEACGILPQIWRTVMDCLVTNERVKVLAIGNLTDPLSEFGQVCEGKDPKWHIVRISTKDTPNYIEGKEIIPGVTGRAYEERMRLQYGVDSNEYRIGVLGQAPDYREGTFYGKELAKARKDGRIGHYPHDPTAIIYKFLDLGDMYNAGIDIQLLAGRIRIIDCYWDNNGEGIPGVVKTEKVNSFEKDYIYDKEHWAGPDLLTSNKKAGFSGMMTKDIADQLKIELTPIIPHSLDDGIAAVRSIWPLLEINEATCKVFLNAVKGYRKKKAEALSTEEQPSYHQTPVPNAWENHMMDAFRHLAVAYRYMKIGGKYIGYTEPEPVYPYGEVPEENVYDPMDLTRL